MGEETAELENGEVALEEAAPPEPEWVWGTGRRKTSVARVRIRAGTGRVEVNRKPLEKYLPSDRLRARAVEPLKAVKMEGKLDVFVNARGGGLTGQAEAILMGLARCIAKMDPGTEPVLRSAGHLTRDARVVERKKYGQRGARRRYQYSKR